MMTPQDVAVRLGCVRVKQVYAWIRGGYLRAINLGSCPDRPRWFITEQDLAVFLERRASDWAPPRRKTRLRRRSGDGSAYIRQHMAKVYKRNQEAVE